MEISAVVANRRDGHEASVRTGPSTRALTIPEKDVGRGSAVNGGELLMLALATCYCNDLFREADRMGIPMDAVEVTAKADFPGIGLAATNIRYSATVTSPAPESVIRTLLSETDAVAEIHNTIRTGVAVVLE